MSLFECLVVITGAKASHTQRRHLRHLDHSPHFLWPAMPLTLGGEKEKVKRLTR